MPLPAHKALHRQSILQGDLNGGNTFFTESLQDHIYGFSADLDLASDFQDSDTRNGPSQGTHGQCLPRSPLSERKDSAFLRIQ